MDFYDMQGFGIKVKEIRKKRKYSRDHITELTGISKGALTNIENGISIPKLDTLHLLSIALKVDLIEVFNEYKFNQSNQFYRFSTSTYSDIIEENIVNLTKRVNDYTEKLINSTEKAQHLVKKSVERELTFFRVYSAYDHMNDKDPERSISEIFQYLEDIEYDFVGSNSFDYIDLRLAFLLVDLFRRTGQLNKAELYLEKIEQKLNESYIQENVVTELKFLLYSSFSYVHHRKSNHIEALRYANLGIEHSYKHNNFLFLYILFFRKVIALHRLEDSDYKLEVEKTVAFLASTNQGKLLLLVVASLEKQYPDVYNVIERNDFLMRIIQEEKNKQEDSNHS